MGATRSGSVPYPPIPSTGNVESKTPLRPQECFTYMTYNWVCNCRNVSPVGCSSLRYHESQTKIGLPDLSRSKIRRMTPRSPEVYFVPASMRKWSTNECISATENGRPVANACLLEGHAPGTKAIGHSLYRELPVNCRLQDRISRHWRALNKRLM